MADFLIERLGGLANFGGPRSAIRSRGEINLAELDPDERSSLAEMFDNGVPAEASLEGDAFRYRITRTRKHGNETIEVPESLVPEALVRSIRTELI